MSRQPGQHGRVGRRWRTVQQQVFTTETHCWLCGQWVDPALQPRHAMARTADHLVQLQHGGNPYDRANLRMAHNGCNARRSAQMQGLPVERCACSHGMPCAALNPTHPRGCIELDPLDV